jgi:manganese/zinc/iron transport system substrate-binding protein
MGSGVDPHLYKATQGDLRRLQSADLVLYNGLKLEGKLGEILEKLGNTKSVLAISEQVPDSLLLDDPEYVGNPDPHIWFDVALWSKCIPSVQNALTSLDSSKASYFESRAKAYADSLTLLHQEVSTAIQQIPEEQRILITAHDAFHYFGRAYGMEVRGLQGISTLSEFGLRDRIDFVNFIVDRKIKAVFVETSVSKKNIRSIIEGCETMGHQVVIGGELFSDAMGEEGSAEGTYIGMVRHNVKQIVESLNP